jgi:hypothetical protein
LVAVTLPLSAVFNSFGTVLAQILPAGPGPTRIASLAQILPSSPGPTRIAALASSGRAYGGAADGSRCECAPTLQEIGCCIAPSSRTRCAARSSGTRGADCARRGTRNVEEII